jgi:hypothetical protein
VCHNYRAVVLLLLSVPATIVCNLLAEKSYGNRLLKEKLMPNRKVFKKKGNNTFPRTMVRIRTSGDLNPAASRSGQTITTVPANKLLVIETISANIRIPKATPAPEVARLVIVTGSAFPPETGSPLLDIPMTRMATDPAGNFVNHVALANMRAYATDGLVQYSIDLSIPSGGSFDLSLFGYLIPAKSRSLAP